MKLILLALIILPTVSTALAFSWPVIFFSNPIIILLLGFVSGLLGIAICDIIIDEVLK